MKDMLPFFGDVFGNPHSEHGWGWDANAAIERARFQIASNIGADTDEVFFTSGATEANNIAILGLTKSPKAGRTRILVSAIEHKTVLESASSLQGNNLTLEIIPVNYDGEIDIVAFEELMSDDVILVSVMATNNEIGSLQQLKTISAICHSYGAIFHTDASQALCSIDIDVYADEIDVISLSGHKIYGPKGIGALYVRRDIQKDILPLMHGGGQESGIRPGTLPTPLCVGFGKAMSLLEEYKNTEREAIKALRNQFFSKIKQDLPDVQLIGPPLHRRHIGNINILFPGVDAHQLLGVIQPNIAASSGSACTISVLHMYWLL